MSYSAEDWDCLSERTISDYVMNCLSSADEKIVEEHLLFCSFCAEKVLKEQNFRHAIVDAFAAEREEKRSTPRRRDTRHVIVRRANRSRIFGHAADVSQGGAGIFVCEPLRVGEIVSLQIGTYVRSATVIYCTPSGPEYRVGLEILSPRIA